MHLYGGNLYDIVAGPDGNLWFTEFFGNNVGRMTTAGVLSEYFTGGAPIGITAGLGNRCRAGCGPHGLVYGHHGILLHPGTGPGLSPTWVRGTARACPRNPELTPTSSDRNRGSLPWTL